MLIAALPSPRSGIIRIGPLQLTAYGLAIAVAVLAALRWATRRWVRRGGSPEDLSRVAIWAVPAGLIGARIYHVMTDYQRFEGRWWATVAIWQGGLGSWGAIAGGTVVGLWRARQLHLDGRALLDAVAPALALAQAIGRLGNWFNQELFGRPTDLPWGLRIDVAHRPAGFETFTTFHPAFLYEMLWNLLVVIPLVLWVERRGRLPAGALFVVYVAAYTFGRFWIEQLRIDPARLVGGVRINEFVSLGNFMVAVAVLVAALRYRNTHSDT